MGVFLSVQKKGEVRGAVFKRGGWVSERERVVILIHKKVGEAYQCRAFFSAG